MTGRTCQFCGKPLSRFSVGSGGDFCSREHRNQFRLRLGMDRLMEANKVASLMRRRENAKAFPAALLLRDFNALPRPSAPVRLAASNATARPMSRRTTQLEATGFSPVSRNLRLPYPAPAPLESAARTLQSASSFPGRKRSAMLRPRTQTFPVQLRSAGIVPFRFGGSVDKQRRREFAAPGWSLARTHIGRDGIQLRRLASLSQNCQEPQKARSLINSADRGRELRVSGGIGFRPPLLRFRSVAFKVPRPTVMLSSTEALGMLSAARPRNAESKSAEIRIAIRGVFGPTPPAKNGAIHFSWPSAMVSGGSIPQQAAEAARSCRVDWTAPAPCPPQLRVKNGAARFNHATMPVRLSSTPAPQPIDSVRRLTLVAFKPQETSFELSLSALHGTLTGGMPFGSTALNSTAVKRKEAPASVALEEHFDAGLRNWLGGTDDWRVDVAGARAGSLALYSPSLEFPDYLLEFLARIENRSVTWVLRAADFDNYYRATLAIAPTGAFEFRRCAVIGGTPETPIGCPVAAPSTGHGAKTTVTLRTEISGDTFTVSLDGKVIDTWNDSRLSTGGIGFVGAPDDRARLYWVKLTLAGHITKEYLKQ